MRGRGRVAALLAVLAASTTVTATAAQAPVPAAVTLLPASDTQPTGVCNPFTARTTDETGQPVPGTTLDVLQRLSGGNEPTENRELYFCDPDGGRNPTGPGDTAIRDVSGNNPAQVAGEPGRNTAVHAEVGPTDANGEITFGITMAPDSVNGTVSVTVWSDSNGDDERDPEEPFDASQMSWFHSDPPVSAVDAFPESASNANGMQHTVTVVVRNGFDLPMQGFVPSSVIAPDATGRPGGDVVNQGAGPSPNYTGAPGVDDVYSCTPTNAEGVSTCAFQDPLGTGLGTDTVVFFADRGGTARAPDIGTDPQDAVQKTWTAPIPTPTPPPSPSPAPSLSPSASPSPSSGAAEARNVRLCHGDATGGSCDTAPRLMEAGDEHFLAALVTDGGGRPIAGVAVELRETGPGRFTTSGTDSVVGSTGADGIARAVLTSDGRGTSSIAAEIPAASTVCEEPAGNCVSNELEVAWEEQLPAPECSDGIDNDDDYLIDFGEDPACVDEMDDTETPGNYPPEPVRKHDRTIGMRFRHRGEGPERVLVVFGRVRLDDGDTFRRCVRDREVRIQRRVGGEWDDIRSTTTDHRGRYVRIVSDRPGRYRAVAPLVQILVDDTFHNCRRAVKGRVHRHYG